MFCKLYSLPNTLGWRSIWLEQVSGSSALLLGLPAPKLLPVWRLSRRDRRIDRHRLDRFRHDRRPRRALRAVPVHLECLEPPVGLGSAARDPEDRRQRDFGADRPGRLQVTGWGPEQPRAFSLRSVRGRTTRPARYWNLHSKRSPARGLWSGILDNRSVSPPSMPGP